MDHKLLTLISLSALLCFIMLMSSNLANGTDKLTTMSHGGRKILQLGTQYGPGAEHTWSHH
ncbi:hypothetical protein CTI12_AA539050 [Artemisia annua]|uniref:Transmembrane protein n=1 Tax=Artemisia annua TaxID=35608 RepID=A0A2U1KXC0_ARTAN|nr:hypothetical protein CTI12_AA539050 [Artemisia annua]